MPRNTSASSTSLPGTYRPDGANNARLTDDIKAEIDKLIKTGTSSSSPQSRSKAMELLGVDPGLYDKLTCAAKTMECLIFIRATNSGVIGGFAEYENTTGKTLVTKGKSSEFLPFKANLAFFSLFAKSNIRSLQAKSSAGKDDPWPTIFKEQDALLKVVLETEQRDKLKIRECVHPTFLYVPKLATFSVLNKQLNLNLKEPPSWIEFESDQYYNYKATTLLTPPSETSSTVDPTGQTRKWRFLWVKVGKFDDANGAFQQQMKNQWRVIMRDQGGAPGDFAGSLVPFAEGEEDEVYYRLYVRAEDVEYGPVPAPGTKDAVADTPAQPSLPGVVNQEGGPTPPSNNNGPYWKMNFLPSLSTGDPYRGISPSQMLEAFAPFADRNVDPKREYRLMPVMAQAKLAEDKQSIQYFEIVADYDVFCICVRLDQIQTSIRKRPSDVSVDMALKPYFPGFQTGKLRAPDASPPERLRAPNASPPERLRAPNAPPPTSTQIKGTRGMISPFEESVRKAINAALLGKENNQDAQSGRRFALHGCEVNNYFYTEKFDDLIMVLPVDPTSIKDCRFRIQSDTFVKLAGRVKPKKESEKIQELPKKSKLLGFIPLKELEYNIGLHYLFIYNMQWGTSQSPAVFDDAGKSVAERLGALLERAEEQLDNERKNLEKVRESTSADQGKLEAELHFANLTHRHICRIAFYAGYYYNVSQTLAGNAIHVWDDTAKEVCRKVLKGFEKIEQHASKFRTKLNLVYPTEKGAPFAPSLGFKGQRRSDIYQEADPILKKHIADLPFGTEQILDELEEEKNTLTTQLKRMKSIEKCSDSDKYVSYILDHWFYHGPYDYVLDNRKFMEEVYLSIVIKRTEMTTSLIRSVSTQPSSY